jgi:hypothetical protein
MKTLEQSDTFTSVDLQDKLDSNYELEFTHVEGTPFTIVKQGNEYYGLIGNHRITESYLNKEVITEEIKKITWDRLLQVIWAVSKKFNETDINLETNE